MTQIIDTSAPEIGRFLDAFDDQVRVGASALGSAQALLCSCMCFTYRVFMPVPTPQTEASPRRLLRDVVFEKLLASIMDGTLEPGERLNDEELVRWLGVSRTPIREAIASLNSWGLVELEANRYTKVATRDPEAFTEASRFLGGLHDLAASWDGRASTPGLVKRLSSVSKKISAHDVEGSFELLDVYGDLVVATGNALFAATELPMRTRVKFLSPRDADEYDWDHLEARAAALREALGGK